MLKELIGMQYAQGALIGIYIYIYITKEHVLYTGILRYIFEYRVRNK